MEISTRKEKIATWKIHRGSVRIFYRQLIMPQVCVVGAERGVSEPQDHPPPSYVRLDSRCSRASKFVAEQKLMNDIEIITGPRHTAAPRHRFDSNRICETRFCSSLLSRACADWRASNCIYMPGCVVNFRRRSAMHSRRYCPRSCVRLGSRSINFARVTDIRVTYQTSSLFFPLIKPPLINDLINGSKTKGV